MSDTPNPPGITMNIGMVVELAPEEVWPDGVPEHWTEQDVLDMIADSRPTLHDFVSDWCLNDFWVDIEGAKGQVGLS